MAAGENFSLSVQAVILLITIILFVIYYYSLFACQKHNFLALYFSIVTFLWFLTVSYRYFTQGDTEKEICDEIEEERKYNRCTDLFDVPYSIKCTIGDSKCHQTTANHWLAIHAVIYGILGVVSQKFGLMIIEVIVISIICEMLESALGHDSKFVLDPLNNVVWYLIGYSLSRGFQCNNVGRCRSY